MPEISIIVPVYQAERYICRCLDSIIAQTFSDFELFLVDDGSKDNSGRICDQYAHDDKRIIVFHTANHGQATARNIALKWLYEHSNSQYITFIDSDDWVHPNYLEYLREALITLNVDISQSLYIETDKVSEYPKLEKIINCITSKEAYLDWYCAFMCGKMFRRSTLKSIRFPDGRIYEDVAIWYKLLFSSTKIGLVQNVLYYYYVNPESTVRKEWRPANLYQIKVWEEQIAYFKEYGDVELYESALKHFFEITFNQKNRIKKSNSLSWMKKRQYILQLDAKLKRQYFLLPDNQYVQKRRLWYLSIAFPAANWIYWTGKGIKKKLLGN